MSALAVELNEIQFSALKEIVNIGTGHAVAALEEMTGTPFRLATPSAGITAVDGYRQRMGGPEAAVVAVYMPVTGDIDGHMAFILPEPTARQLQTVMMSASGFDADQIEEVGDSIFVEVGNVLLSSFLNALSDMTGLALHATVPMVAIDMAEALINTIVCQSEFLGEHALTFMISLEENNEIIDGSLVLIPEPGSLPVLLESLGLGDTNG